MVNKIKKKLRDYVKRKLYKHQCSSDAYIRWLTERGAKIGSGTTIFDPQSTLIDVTRPYMIEIGDNVQITRGVTILTHGYDWAVLKNVYGDILGSCGKVKIGNNVFIGMHTTILKGVNIGNNIIIGANSLVNCDLEDNSVYGGNPVRFIMTLDDYYKKRINAQFGEAYEQVLQYERVFKKRPDKQILREFFFLFEEISGNQDNHELYSEYEKMLSFTGNYELSKRRFLEKRKESQFRNIDDFIEYCELRMQTSLEN